MIKYVAGLDLGQLSDRTALSVVERRETGNRWIDEPRPPLYACRHLQVWHPGTKYTKVLNDTIFILNALDGEAKVALDVTVAGEAIAKLFAENIAKLDIATTCFTITGGTQQTGSWNDVRIPKRDLASFLRVLLETERLQIAPNLHHGSDMQKEMQHFKAEKVTNDDTVDWRTREHDDLVLATALACWTHDKRQPPDLEALAALFDWLDR